MSLLGWKGGVREEGREEQGRTWERGGKGDKGDKVGEQERWKGKG